MIAVTTLGATSSPARPADPEPGLPRRRTAGRSGPSARDQLEQLRFLHEVARLATTARTWDELLETVVDRTRDVLHADVSSLYLLDRDGAYLTLAATNGLDRFQIGRARVPFGEGVTGRVASKRRHRGHPRREGRPALPVGSRHRPAPVRRLDALGPADLARPDRGRAERPDRADRAASAKPTWRQLGAVADLLAGIIEKGRQQSEAEARRGGPQGDRRCAQRTHRPGHPRTANAVGRRPRLCRPAGR